MSYEWNVENRYSLFVNRISPKMQYLVTRESEESGQPSAVSDQRIENREEGLGDK